MRQSYYLMILIYLGYIVVESYLAIRDSYQWSVGLFVAVDVWAILMAIKGLKSLNMVAESKVVRGTGL